MAFVVGVGSVIAERYRLETCVGEGGMGVVWAATHLPTGRAVALKLLKETELDERARRRFLREARAPGTIAHEGVVAVHDVLVAEDGALALVMDLLDGESLAQRLARGPRCPLGETTRILLEVCEVVQAAHAAGVVHRDLKPENVFLMRDGRVRVLDFGIAKLTGAGADEGRSAATQTGTVLGTPFYMSPEQAFGEKDVDGRSDVWSFGVVMYEALAGILPTRAESLGQVLKIILTGAIPPLVRVAPEIPVPLAEVVDRMLSRDRTRRPALAEVGAALALHAGATPSDEAPAEAASRPEASALAHTVALLPTPETRYAETADGFSIAYHTFGSGGVDLVIVPGIVSHLEAFWEEPEGVRFFSMFGSFARVLVFDKRGSGLSDRLPGDGAPSLEERMEDLRAVMDAAGVERAVIMGVSEGGPMSALFAATRPERTRGLVLCGTAARFKPGPATEMFVKLVQDSWGKGALSPLFAPGAADDPRIARWFARVERLSATPRAAVALAELLPTMDVRHVLAKIVAPTLVLRRGDDVLVSAGASRQLAAGIPNARLIEYPTGPHHPMAGDFGPVLHDIEAFVREVTAL